MDGKYFLHAIPVNAGDAFSFILRSPEEFLVVGADIRAPTIIQQMAVNQFQQFTLAAPPWQPAYLMTEDFTRDTLPGGRGVSFGGFDGIPYAQFARPDEDLIVYFENTVRLLFVLTNRATPPDLSIRDVTSYF